MKQKKSKNYANLKKKLKNRKRNDNLAEKSKQKAFLSSLCK